MKIKKILVKLGTMFADALYVEHIKCLNCGKDLPKQNIYDICDKCKEDMPFNNGRRCMRCGKNVIGEANYCFACKNTERHFDRAVTPFLYSGIVAKLIKRFKYNNAPYLAKTFARWLAQEYAKSDFEVDIVVPVPMHEEKLKKRGYNQAELLAIEFCKITKLPLDTTHLIKKVNLATQTQKSYDERAEVEDIYALTEKKYFKGKKVLVIDDVITTGATLDACAKTLNASKVYGLAVANTRTRIKKVENNELLKDKKFRKKIAI